MARPKARNVELQGQVRRPRHSGEALGDQVGCGLGFRVQGFRGLGFMGAQLKVQGFESRYPDPQGPKTLKGRRPVPF